MHPFLRPYFASIPLGGDIAQDSQRLLNLRGLPRVAEHVARVATKTAEFAVRYDFDPQVAVVGAWLHDIGAIIPNNQRIKMAAIFGLEIFAEEAQVPMILHQKLGAVIAQDCFGVQDRAVIDAIGCHTTLKANAGLLEKILFIADKIAWDQEGVPPYLAEIEKALAYSLDDACRVYLRYLWAQKAKLPVVHRWFLAAYDELCAGSE